MHDAPPPAQIAQAAERFLRERAAPALAEPLAHEHLAFHARVAANLLAIAAREMAEPPEVAAAERRRLMALLDAAADDPRDLTALNLALADAVANGQLDAATPGLVDHLWQVTLAKLAVDQPNYATYLACRQAEGAPR